jgi:hypothetical protein
MTMPPDGNYIPSLSDPIVAAVSETQELHSNPEITRLAALSLAEYEKERASAANKLGYRKSALDKMVEAERTKIFL